MNRKDFPLLHQRFKIIFFRFFFAIIVYLAVPSLVMSQSSNGSSGSDPVHAGIGTWNSSIIYHGENDHLIYHSDADGNRIPDFSHAGYHGGGVDLPKLSVYITLSPSSTGDDTQQIQEALDQAGSLQKNSQGHRGAVLLNPGIYHISNRITIPHSGVVLRGSGNGDDPSTNTIIYADKNIGNTSIQIGSGSVNWNAAQNSPITEIITEYIPVGSRTFEVENSAGFDVGDDIIVFHRASEEWVEAVDYGGRPLSEPNPWKAGESNLNIQMKRKIVGISGNTVAVDVPVYNHLDRTLSEVLIYKPNFSQLVTESGVESFRLILESDDPQSDVHGNHAIYFDGVEDSWADSVTVMHFRNTGIGTTNSSFVTIQNSQALEPHSPIIGARRYNFNVSTRSNNILITGNTATEGRHCFVSNGTASVSGVVFHNSISYGAHNTSEGHRRWSQGLLFDNLVFKETNDSRIIGLYNRGDWGTRHGWSSAHSVVWNSDPDTDKRIFIQKPPTAQNYGIANRGMVTGDGPWEGAAGHIEGTGETPVISSLYEAQLQERLEHGTPPDAPGNVTLATLPDEQQSLRLEWVHNSLSEVDIIIERSVNGNAFEVLAELRSNTSSFTVEIEDDADYRYRVAARDEGRLSAWSNVVGMNLNMTSFVLRSPASGTVISLTEDKTGNLNLWWDETESDIDFNYTWYLDHADGDFSNPIMERTTDIQLVEVPYNEIYDTLINEGIEPGSTFEGIWSVKAAGEGREKWADEPFDIAIQVNNTATSIDDETESGNPDKFSLLQNAPNPFNPTTIIRYDVPSVSHVTIEVYSITGQLIKTLVNKVQQPGSFEVSFDASQLSSGIYIYRMMTDSGVHFSKKMVLVK